MTGHKPFILTKFPRIPMKLKNIWFFGGHRHCKMLVVEPLLFSLTDPLGPVKLIRKNTDTESIFSPPPPIHIVSSSSIVWGRGRSMEFSTLCLISGSVCRWNEKLWTHVLLWGQWYPCFGLLVMSPLSFKARVDSLIWTWQRCIWCTFPKIHLWCDTCKSLDSQQGGWSLFPTRVLQQR